MPPPVDGDPSPAQAPELVLLLVIEADFLRLRGRLPRTPLTEMARFAPADLNRMGDFC